MLTNLRAALHTIADEIERCNFASATEKLRAILDAPPTVAELLVGLPEPVDGRGPGVHRVEWEHDGSRFRAYRFGIAGLIVEGDPAGAWSRMSLNHADLTQPARLVEATP